MVHGSYFGDKLMQKIRAAALFVFVLHAPAARAFVPLAGIQLDLQRCDRSAYLRAVPLRGARIAGPQGPQTRGFARYPRALRMTKMNGDFEYMRTLNTLADAEQALDDAIADGDPDGMTQCIKAIEMLQLKESGEAGGKPFQKKRIIKAELDEAVMELLFGQKEDDAADDVVDALTTNALEEMAVELQVAEAAVEWAISHNDAQALRRALRHLSNLQEVCGGFTSATPFDDQSPLTQFPDAMAREISGALERAAREQGLDEEEADERLGLLDDTLAGFLGDVDDKELVNQVALLELDEAIAQADEKGISGALEALDKIDSAGGETFSGISSKTAAAAVQLVEEVLPEHTGAPPEALEDVAVALAAAEIEETDGK